MHIRVKIKLLHKIYTYIRVIFRKIHLYIFKSTYKRHLIGSLSIKYNTSG